MRVKKKLTAIFAILVMIVSFFVVVQFPAVQAQPPYPMVAPRDMTFKDPATGLPIPSPGTLPMNLTYDHIVNATLLGKLLIVAVYLVPPAGGVNLSSYKVGFTFNPAVLRVAKDAVYNVTPAPGLLPDTVFTGKGAVMTPGSILNYWGNVTSYNVTLTTPGDFVTVTAATPLLYVVFIVNYYGESSIGFTTNAWATQTALADQNGLISPIIVSDGYFKYGIHLVSISSGFDVYWGDPPPPYPSLIGENLTVTVSIKNTEPIHSWAINISYNPDVLTVPSAALVFEGSYFKMLLINYSFTPTVDDTAGWIHVNCTALSGQNRTGDGLLMGFIAIAEGYGISPFIITSFTAVDNYGNTIPNLELQHSLTDPAVGFQFEKAPIVSVVDPGTGAPMSKYWTTATHTIGDTFLAAIQLVQTSQQVHSWKAGFRFNPRVLQVNYVVDAGYLPNSTWTPGVIDNTNGIVTSFNSTAAPGNYTTGGGTLMLINFTVIDYGLSHITLTDLDGDDAEVKLIGLNGKEIKTPSGLVFTDHDYPNPGVDIVEFEFRAGVTIKIEPQNWFDTAPSTFTMKLTINTTEKVYSWNLGLSFDASILECIGVAEGPYLKTVASTSWSEGTIDNTNGIVYPHGSSLIGDYYATGSGIIAYVTFKNKTAIPPGGTLIELINSVVSDIDGFACTLVTLVNASAPLGPFSVPGDADADGHVKLSDLTILAGSWYKPVIDPRADFDGDGFVKLSDLTILAGNWYKI